VLISGADAVPQTIIGFTQAMTGDMSPKSWASSVLVTTRIGRFDRRERVPGFEDIPTAREQGFDGLCELAGFMCPKASRMGAFSGWAERLKAIAESEGNNWQASIMYAPFTKVGGD
jgi:putative tricarboxylic transport membrane protein